jgi:hypothetical protein
MVTREIEHDIATIGHVFLEKWVESSIENAANIERVDVRVR